MDAVSLFVGVALFVVAIGVVARARAAAGARFALVAAMIACAVAFLSQKRSDSGIARGPRIVRDVGRDAFVGSGACIACHPSEHASWSKTFHRTMTEVANARTMLAHPGSREPIVMTTGSHHMQGYWTEDDRGALHMLPVVFSREENALIARADAFLEPPNASQHDVRWNSNCIACHATGARPAIDSGRAPIVAELGVACEACHGAGGEHAALERNPFTRAFGARGDARRIVNPAKLGADRSSAVCGSCHAYSFPRDEEKFLRDGYADSYTPGDALEPSRIILTPGVLARGDVSLDTDARNLFWPDGTVRVGGREYNAMILSACFARGEGEKKIACTSCHSMHQSDPDDQLRRDRSVQDACISCHEMPRNHSRHAKGSPGDACVSCHMPKTSYALRYAIRSHRIDSPRATRDKPNACNLCHLDRTLEWTRDALRAFGVRDDARDAPVARVPDVPESVRGLLEADAAERVIWADAFGERAARDASGADWESAVLDVASRDPYAVIRFIAARSKRAYPSATRALVSREAIDALVSTRDNRDVDVAE